MPEPGALGTLGAPLPGVAVALIPRPDLSAQRTTLEPDWVMVAPSDESSHRERPEKELGSPQGPGAAWVTSAAWCHRPSHTGTATAVLGVGTRPGGVTSRLSFEAELAAPAAPYSMTAAWPPTSPSARHLTHALALHAALAPLGSAAGALAPGALR